MSAAEDILRIRPHHDREVKKKCLHDVITGAFVSTYGWTEEEPARNLIFMNSPSKMKSYSAGTQQLCVWAEKIKPGHGSISYSATAMKAEVRAKLDDDLTES